MGFQRYVPRVALSWLADACADHHRRIPGTLVFADISGFTALSERLASLGREGAEELTAHIDEVLGGLLEGELASSGDLLAFGGDAILLLFTGDDHERRGAAAAAEMRASVRANGLRRTPMGRVRLKISIGVNSGDVDLFLVGDSHLQLLTAGPVVTELLALESAASAGQIALGMSTAAALPSRSVGAPLGPGYLLARRPAARPSARTDQLHPDVEPLIPTALRLELSGPQEPEHRIVSVAFLHARGLDALIEKDAEYAAGALHTVVASAQRRFAEHDMTFLAADVYDDGVKVIGVGGAPRATGTDEERLLRALRSLVDDVADGPLAVRAGIHRGTAFVGAVGTDRRAAYTVMGDTVNTAARVMSRAGDGELLATPGVLDRSGTQFELTSIEPFAAKGKAEPIHASAVGALIGPKPRVGEAFPLVGRDAERDRLAALVEQGGALEIVAGPGLGKSRLVAETAAIAEAQGRDVARLQCELYEQGTPHFLTRLLLERVTGGLDAKSLAAVARDRAPDAVPWLPLVGTALGIEMPPTRQSTELAEPLRAQHVAQAVAAVVLSASPGLLVVEDTHWLDPSSLGVLRALVAAASSTALVITRRPEGEGALGEGYSIALQPLDDAAVTALARMVRGRAGIHPTDAAAIAERAGGNPLYALELVRGLDAGLSDTLEAAITATIDRLEPEARRQLRLLSVLGTRFDPGLARTVSAELGASADFGALADFIQPTQGELAFRHALYRDVAYEGLPYRQRRSVHARVASVIEQSTANPDDEAETLSLHYFEAARWPQAFRYSRLAAKSADERSALVECAAFWERAATAVTRFREGRTAIVETMLELSTALANISETERAKSVAVRARRRAGDALTAARASMVLADIAGQRVELRDQFRAASDGLRRLEGIDEPRLRMILMGARLYAMAQLGRVEEALSQSDELVDAARASADVSQLARALAVRQFIRNRAGLHDASDGIGAAEIYGKLGNRFGEGVALNNAGTATETGGDWDSAARLYERAAEALTAAGAAVMALGARFNATLLKDRQGRWSEALPELEELVAAFVGAHRADFALVSTTELALSHARLGSWSRAFELRDSAVAMMANRAVTAEERALRLELCEVLVLAGRHDDTIAEIDDCIAETATERVLADLWRGYALIGLGDLVGATTALERATATDEQQAAPFFRGLAEHALAAVAEQVGQDPEPHRTEARRIFHALGVGRVIDVPSPT